MKIALALIFGIMALYGAIATLLPQSMMVGHFGTYLGTKNIALFGYIGYIDFFAVLIPLIVLLRMHDWRACRCERWLAWLLWSFSLLILQALIIQGPMGGWIGKSVVDLLFPSIGLVGVWLFWLLMFGVASAILWGEPLQSIFASIFSDMKEATQEIVRQTNAASDDAITKADPMQKEAPSAASQPSREHIFQENQEETTGAREEGVLIAGEESEHLSEMTEPPYTEKKSKPSPQKTIAKEKTDTEVATMRPSASIDMPASDESSQLQESPIRHVEIVQELEENRKLLEEIAIGEREKPQNFKLPPIDFLQKPPQKTREINEAEIDAKINDLLQKLSKFKIEGDVVRTYAGPVVTTFEFKPAAHIKVSKILNLQDDLAMALKAKTIRIQAPVPGKDVVGIEIPNKQIETIYLREILEDPIFKKSKSPLTIALGKDIVGKPFVTDLSRLPHLLIAGTTGSGKSVGINAMILSLLYRNGPENLRLMMIDPKMLEFSVYNDIPHLLTPVITQPKKAITALANMVAEMERRYHLMSQTKTKNIETYNEKAKKEKRDRLPYIVVVIDELADLMMTGGKDVEFSIARLAQMARASGIHLIIATQRPSVDVVTGLIKANLPSRISFKVGQKIDSKVILDTVGAESLLGRGDMLFTKGGGAMIRLHAPWSSEGEIEEIVEYLKAQQPVVYDERFLEESDADDGIKGNIDAEGLDELYDEAKKIVLSEHKTSISYLQRRLQIGYNRAARIVEQLETMGILSAPDSKGNREIISG